MAVDIEDPRPSYVQVADQLRQAIASGTYAAGSLLPGVRTLAKTYAVAPATAAKAVDVLKAEGLVVGRTGLGTVVRDEAVRAPEPTKSVQGQIDDLRRRVEALEAGGGNK